MIAAFAILALLGGCSAPVKAPSGWSVIHEADRWVYTPDDVPAGDLARVEVYPPEATPSVVGWARATWIAFRGSYNDVQEQQIGSKEANGRQIAIVGGSMSDGGRGYLYVVIFGVGDGDRVVPVLFVAGSQESYAKYSSMASSIAASVRARGGNADKPFAGRRHSFQGLPVLSAEEAAAHQGRSPDAPATAGTAGRR